MEIPACLQMSDNTHFIFRYNKNDLTYKLQLMQVNNIYTETDVVLFKF